MEADRDTAPGEPGEEVEESPPPVGRNTASGRTGGTRTVLLIVLVLLLSMVVAVIWILPRHVAPLVEMDADDTPVVGAGPAPPSESETRRARNKREAEKALEVVLKRQAVMEAREVSVWAGAEFDDTLDALAEADAIFANQDFEKAKSGYEAAARMLDALEESMPERLREALSRGAEALGRYDADGARAQFRVALALDPGNEHARSGADRAGKIEQVSHLLRQAQEAGARDELASARELLEKAVALDPMDPRVRSELSRIGSELEARNFNKLMSEALTAMEDGRFGAAGEALSAADAVRAGAPEIVDARERLRRAIQTRKIGEHRKRAEKFARAESWHEAARELDAVLAIDPQAQFAVQGLAQSRRLATLHDQLDAWLQDPERLQSPQPRENARALLDSPVAGPDDGPRLQQKLDQLAALLVLAETPVPVALVSDGLTDVTIYRVGPVGRFTETMVSLLPGTYVVHGERVGFRDVRLELKVGVGSATPSLVVVCEERI